MKHFIYLFIFFFSLVTSKLNAQSNIMILKLTYGDVHIELYPEKAPNHVKRFKELADSGKIRKLYAVNQTQNSIHGSDSDINANLEINFFFK